MTEENNLSSLIPTPDELEHLKELNGDEHDQCWIAMKAMWDTLAEYCGGVGVPVDIEGMNVNVPHDVIRLAREHPEMSRTERINTVAHTEWCRGVAGDMCAGVFGAKTGTDAHTTCLENVALKIAAKIID